MGMQIMKRISILLLSCFYVLFVMAQERKEFDFIITVDDEFGTLCTPLNIGTRPSKGGCFFCVGFGVMPP